MTPAERDYLDRRAAYATEPWCIGTLPRPPGGWIARPGLVTARERTGALQILGEAPALPLEAPVVHLFDPDRNCPIYHVQRSRDLLRELRRRASWRFYVNVRYWQVDSPNRQGKWVDVIAKAWAPTYLVRQTAARLLERPVWGLRPWQPDRNPLPFWP